MQSHQRLVAMLWLAAATAVLTDDVRAVRQPSSNCQRKCGDVDIPYPFGIGPDDCAMPGFILRCNTTGGGGSGPFVSFKPYINHVDVESISLQQGEARMLGHISSACYNATSHLMDDTIPWILNFTNTPYRFSNTKNRFTVIGCSKTLAYIEDVGNNGEAYIRGCAPVCEQSDVARMTNGSCSGTGCCQTDIPEGLQSYLPNFYSGFNTTQKNDLMSTCIYAVLMDTSNLNFSGKVDEFNSTNRGKQPLAIDWAIGNDSCEVAQQKNDTYACVSSNSQCKDSSNGPGYICICKEGYAGNPYLQDPEQGCKDIDECNDKKTYPCYGTCRNKEGGYDCFCPHGTRGNATIGPCMDAVTKGVQTAIGICTAVFFCLIILLGVQWIKHKQHIRRQSLINERDAYFRQHGGQLLIDMMKIENNISFKLYCLEDIELATNNFDDRAIIGEGGQGTVFIGYGLDPDNDPVAIKRCKGLSKDQMTEFGQELLILSRATHKNIVKLLGCSLHFEAPVLVYEFVPNKTLQYLIHFQDQASKRTLEIRLKIAAESAEALAYLHTLSHPIFHGDVKSANILLGHDLSAKVSDFGCSLIRPAEENLQAVKGTMGYLDPEYLLNFSLTDKSDVYSFGVVLLELITRRMALSKEKESLVSIFMDAVKEGKLAELVDPEIADQVNIEVVCQVAELARQCLAMTGASRPTMSQVAEELRRLVGPEVHVTGGLDCGTPITVQRWSSTSTSNNDSTGDQSIGYQSFMKNAAISIEFAR